MLLQYIHIILLLMMPSILRSALVPPAEKHPHNMMLPPLMLHGWDGGVRLASLPVFPPNITMVIKGQTVLFLFHQTRGHFSKKYNLCPHVHLQTVVWFLWQFWSSGFFLAERPFRSCCNRNNFTVDIGTFVLVSSSIFTRSFAVLGLISTIRTNVR